MSTVYYYIYSKGILGVKTNQKDFKWIYGSHAPASSEEEYEKCLLKFDISMIPEKKLSFHHIEDTKFQAYSWNQKTGTLYYCRTLPLNILIGYVLRIEGNTVYVHIGSNYCRFIKNRTMNLHGVYYLLSDIANMLLLKLGYLTLYASCACHTSLKKGVLCFGAPGTGKTYLSMELCKNHGYSLVGEDVVITDGKRIYGCPWTSSYQNRKSRLDSAFSRGKVHDLTEIPLSHKCELSHIGVLTLGNPIECSTKEQIFRRIKILNGYLFHYYSSPIIEILSFFEESMDQPWNSIAESMLRAMVETYPCCELQCPDRKDFSCMIQDFVSGR